MATFVGLLSGCQSIDGAIKEHGAPATANLAKLAPVTADLATRAAVREDPAAPIDARVTLALDAPRDSSAAIVYVEDLAARGELGNVYARLPGTKAITECASFLDHRTFPWDPQEPARWTSTLGGYEVGEALGLCGRLTTLFVLRTMDLVRPSAARVEASLDGGAAAPSSPPSTGGVAPSESACRAPGMRCRFDGGYIKLEIHVFAVEPFAHRGAFVVEAESSPTAPLSGARGDEGLERDLARQVGIALGKGFAKHVPGATLKGLP